MSFRSALKHRFLSFAVKSLSSILFPISIARAYGADVNGDLQLLIAATGYLGLLDSGMTISAINLGGEQGAETALSVTSKLQAQHRSSRKVFLLGILVAFSLIFWAGVNGFLDSSLFPGAILLTLISILEITFAPYKYHLYSCGKAAAAEKREAHLALIATSALLVWSVMILQDLIPPILGLAVGLLFLRMDRFASGLLSLAELKSLAHSGNVPLSGDSTHQQVIKDKSACSNTSGSHQRAWISALQVFALLNWSSDIFIIKLLVGSSGVSDYAILSKFYMLPVAVLGICSPVIQSAVNQGRLKASLFRRVFRYSWPLIFLLTAFVFALSSLGFFLITSLSSKLGLSCAPSLILLAAFSFLAVLLVFSGFYAPVANALALFRVQVVTSAILLAANIMLSWCLGQYYGMGAAGVVAATGISMAVSSCFIIPRKILMRLCLNEAASSFRHVSPSLG